MGAQGLCFAVASNTAEYVLTQILGHGRVRRGVIGIVAEHVVLPQRLRHRFGLTQPRAIGVRSVQQKGPAETAGLIAGDILVSLDGAPVAGVDDVSRILDAKRINQKVTAHVLRLGEKLEFTLVPEERELSWTAGLDNSDLMTLPAQLLQAPCRFPAYSLSSIGFSASRWKPPR